MASSLFKSFSNASAFTAQCETTASAATASAATAQCETTASAATAQCETTASAATTSVDTEFEDYSVESCDDSDEVWGDYKCDCGRHDCPGIWECYMQYDKDAPKFDMVAWKEAEAEYLRKQEEYRRKQLENWYIFKLENLPPCPYEDPDCTICEVAWRNNIVYNCDCGGHCTDGDNCPDYCDCSFCEDVREMRAESIADQDFAMDSYDFAIRKSVKTKSVTNKSVTNKSLKSKSVASKSYIPNPQKDAKKAVKAERALKFKRCSKAIHNRQPKQMAEVDFDESARQMQAQKDVAALSAYVLKVRAEEIAISASINAAWAALDAME